ncbi:zinc-ribbon domain protein [Wolffia australiana]
MFFFFAGGVEQQAGRVLKQGAGRCFACGSPADLVKVEKVLKLFFVPVWRWQGKDPAMRCESCRLIFPSSFSLPPPGTENPPISSPHPLVPPLKCFSCHAPVDRGFRFCPFCGAAL